MSLTIVNLVSLAPPFLLTELTPGVDTNGQICGEVRVVGSICGTFRVVPSVRGEAEVVPSVCGTFIAGDC